MIDKIYLFLKNIFIYRSELARSVPWDYSGLLLLMKRNIIEMNNYQSSVDYFVGINRDNTCKRMSIVLHAIDRLIEDDYGTCKTDWDQFDKDIASNKRGYFPSRLENNSLYDFPRNRKLCYRIEDSQRRLDLEIVSKYYSKYVIHCWH
jgi:hypothetical protein